MSYSHLPVSLMEEVDKLGKLKTWTWLRALKAHERDPDKTPPLIRTERDRQIRAKMKHADPSDLWTDDGDPSELAFSLVSWGYFPSPKRLEDWLDWHAENG